MFRVSEASSAELQDAATPRHSLLSGRFKQSFAYVTLQNRLPGIMQQVKQTLFKEKNELVEEFGENVLKDIAQIKISIDRLINELVRDRQFTLFLGVEADKAQWNAFLMELPRPKRSYYRACWLHSECYLYRRLYSFFENSKYLRNFDYFSDLKREDLKLSSRAIILLTEATRNIRKDFDVFSKLMRINMWSNRFEVHVTAYTFDAEDSHPAIDVLDRVATLDKHLLVDDTILVWNCLLRAKGQKDIILDYICDNGGFEIFTDLLFMEYVLDHHLVTQVRLHVKAIPWYISDIMEHDVHWTIEYLQKFPNAMVSNLGNKLHRLMAARRIIVAPLSHFWTGPQSYFVMIDSNSELYNYISHAQLAIFKGDLNYRKLLGDYIWDSTEEFITCLRGFRPTNMCAMRNVKCEVICGLPEGLTDFLFRVDSTWMISGKYGVIQYTDSLKCHCDKPAM